MVPVLIMSAERAEYDAHTNSLRTDALVHDLARLNLSAKPVVGAYQGTREESFVVAVPDETSLVRATALATLFDQEGVLYIDQDRRATLLYLATGERVDLGRFRAITRAEAEHADAYTFDPLTDTYYRAV